jgi:hypothetical protein
MKKNRLILTFIIYDFDDLSHDEISQMVGIQPTFARSKGEKKNPGNPDSPLFKNNRWGIDSGIDQHSNFDDHMNALLDIIEPRLDILRSLCSKYYCEISCGMFVYFDNGESTPWVHLDARYNRINAALKMEFDLDLYVLPGNEL